MQKLLQGCVIQLFWVVLATCSLAFWATQRETVVGHGQNEGLYGHPGLCSWFLSLWEKVGKINCCQIETHPCILRVYWIEECIWTKLLIIVLGALWIKETLQHCNSQTHKHLTLWCSDVSTLWQLIVKQTLIKKLIKLKCVSVISALKNIALCEVGLQCCSFPPVKQQVPYCALENCVFCSILSHEEFEMSVLVMKSKEC